MKSSNLAAAGCGPISGEPVLIQHFRNGRHTARFRAIVGALFVYLRMAMVSVTVMLTGGCSRPSEHSSIQAGDPATENAGDQASAVPETWDVVLVPTEEFPPGELRKLAAAVAEDTGLHLKTTLPVGVRDWKPYPDRPQYDPLELEALAGPVITRLKSQYGGRVYLIMTSRDIGPSDKSLNFMFTQHDLLRKISMVSAARLLIDRSGNLAASEIIQTRLRKIVLRTIAIQYYGLKRSADIHDVTYSPLMSLDDLDAMGLNLIVPQLEKGAAGK